MIHQRNQTQGTAAQSEMGGSLTTWDKIEYDATSSCMEGGAAGDVPR